MRIPFRGSAGTTKLRGEEHQPDVAILLSVVGLVAFGILMVYSSSAMSAYINSEGDTYATVGPQVVWALLGLVAMVVMMRVDYRWLRKVSVPAMLVAIVLLVLVLVPGLSKTVGGSARWLQLGPLPARPPGRVREAGADHLPRPLAGRARRPDPRVLVGHGDVPRSSSRRSCSWSSKSPISEQAP